MSKWQDIVIDKPIDKPKQKIKINNSYGDYGFDYSVNMYSLVEENRDFRKHIENEIIMENIRTQNVLGNHITDEIDRNIENTDARANEIKTEINNHHTYIVNTLTPKVNSVKTDTEAIKTTQQTHTNLLQQILNKINSWNW